ncbi:MAG TPA: peptidylprolyl isomerase [Sphingomonadaceae bacterium]|nr:peptidylprolyl isomerase [Sphingomonadaceae bacterium]
MRLKILVAAMAGLFMGTGALAQQTTTGPTGLAEPAVPLVAAAAPAVAPAPTLDPANILDLDLSDGGRVRILLRPDKAPLSVERIKTLVRRGFYNGLTFHRVIEGFMAQGGDPKGDGSGGSDLPDLKAEFNDLPFVRGTVAMARTSKPDTANSQFFIMFMPNFVLDEKYTAVGRVISGMAYVDAIHRGEPPADPTRILHAGIEGDGNVPPPPAGPVEAPAAPKPTPAPAL